MFADAPVLGQHGATRAKQNENDTLSYHGWTFSSLHKNIIDSAESGRLQSSIYARLNLDKEDKDVKDKGDKGSARESGINSGINLRIPPMIFGHDVMKIEKLAQVATVFEDTFSLSLKAEDALTLWAAQHKRDHIGDLHIIQVPYAAIWARNPSPSADGDFAGVKHSTSELQHDDSEAMASSIKAAEPAVSPFASSSSPTSLSAAADAVHIDKRSPLWDWTFSSDYCCTLGNKPNARQHILGIKNLYSPLDSSPDDPLLSSVQRVSSSSIEYDLLRANDVPILFYDEIILYQDDLEDCGEVIFEAKLRVMPHCWFLLSRMFLRIDGVMLRIRDNRFFHRFGTNTVHLEVTWKECKIALKLDKGSKDDSPSSQQGQGEEERVAASKQDPCAGAALHIDGSSMRDINKLAAMVPVVSSFNFTLSC